jgi:hypothetical protein
MSRSRTTKLIALRKGVNKKAVNARRNGEGKYQLLASYQTASISAINRAVPAKTKPIVVFVANQESMRRSPAEILAERTWSASIGQRRSNAQGSFQEACTKVAATPLRAF